MEETIYGHAKKLDFILKHIKEYADRAKISLVNLRVLDFGCGSGIVTIPVGKLGCHVVGVDMHKESIEYAQRNYHFENVSFVRGNEDVLRNMDKKFDVMIFSDVVEHLERPDLVLAELNAIQKDGGILILTTSNGYGPFEIESFIARRLHLKFPLLLILKIRRVLLKENKGFRKDDVVPYNTESPHVQFFTKKRLCQLLEKTGYQPAGFSHGAFLGAPVSERFLGRFKRFIEWNTRVADRLPYWAVSTWYLVCKK